MKDKFTNKLMEMNNPNKKGYIFPALFRPDKTIPSLRATFFCIKLGTECTK